MAQLEVQSLERIRELEITRDAVEAAYQAKNSLMVAMSHELRAPLSAILGFSDLLRSRVTTEEQRRNLDIITNNGKHLLGMIDDLLDAARAESKHPDQKVRTCDLGALIRA